MPHHLLRALGRHLTVVGCIDFSPVALEKLALAGATFRRDRALWRARFHTSLLAHRTLSATLARRARTWEQPFDLALQVYGWARGQPRPYALYVDQTRLMAERGWPQWMPLTPRERHRILEFERDMYRDAEHILVMGTEGEESLASDYGVHAERITVVGGGLMFDEMPPCSGPADQPRVTFVGRDFERKGGDCLLRAFRQVRMEVPDAVLDIVGVTRRLEEPGVVSHGEIGSRQRLAQLYRRTRALCLPSRYEPYGFVLAEAMAHGVPCVATTVQSIPEILDYGRAGLLVPPSDEHALAAALVRLLQDDDLARALGQAGRRQVEQKLTWDHVAARAAPVLSAVARANEPTIPGPI
jgi:glycosyltransferase involved in cell wall biosynthesis